MNILMSIHLMSHEASEKGIMYTRLLCRWVEVALIDSQK